MSRSSSEKCKPEPTRIIPEIHFSCGTPKQEKTSRGTAQLARCILLIHLGRLNCNDRGPLCTLFPDRPRSTIMALRCCLMLSCVTEPLQTIPARSTSNARHWSMVHWSCGVIMQRCFCLIKRLPMINLSPFSRNLSFRSVTMIGAPVGEIPSKCRSLRMFSDLLPFSPSQAQHLRNLLREPVWPPSCDCLEFVWCIPDVVRCFFRVQCVPWCSRCVAIFAPCDTPRIL